MKTLTQILLAVVFAAGLLSGCAFGSGSDDQNKNYKEEKDSLLRDFEPVLGTYVGEVEATNDLSATSEMYKIPLEFGIYVEYVADGIDANGKSVLRPGLKMRYRQMDTARADVILDVRYTSATGELDAAPKVAKPGDSVASNTTIRGLLSGTELRGSIVRNGGTLGQFRVMLKSRAVIAPYSDQNLYERTVIEYKKIAGLYVGTVTGTNQAPFPVQIQLSFTPVASANGELSAQLKASYRRLDFADPSTTERLLTVSYRLDTDPAQLVMSGDGSTPQIPNAYFMSLNGILKDGTYTADFYDRRGFVGTLTVKR